MKQTKIVGLALAAALVLGTAGCNSQEAAEKAYKADAAKYEKAAADQKAMRRAGFVVECISALQWKRAFLAKAPFGSADIYIKHYRAELEKTLGDTSIPAADGAPELSKASIDPYLAWAYDRDVKTKFTSGRDFNNDGTLESREKNAQGNSRVTVCIQQAAEKGVGPLVGSPDMYSMRGLRGRLDNDS